MKFDRQIYNIILIHVSRTWERIRVKQPHEEMPCDNIESTEYIEEIASIIIDDSIIQEFLSTKDGNVWSKTKEGMSDFYIETLAHNLIMEEYPTLK